MLSELLRDIWDQQREYNEKIFAIEGTNEPNYWSRQYLLGLTSQVAEVLHEIKWKRHRNENGKKIVRLNVLEEIADIAKFTISLAQIWGFSAEQVLQAVYEKGEILDFRLKMEFKEPLHGKKILITDVDGTLADYASTFKAYLPGDIFANSAINTLLIDDSLQITYPDYYEIKEKFEEDGGYRGIFPYSDTANALQNMKRLGYYIIVVTSRPAKIYKRIFKDTLYWFGLHNLPIDELYMLGSDRILLACELAKDNEVILWEDDPEILRRASNSNITTFARKHAYNSDLILPSVKFIDSYI